MANELALRDTLPTSSRFGPTDATGRAAAVRCGARRRAQARLSMELDATVDLRPIGSIDLTGTRDGRDFRWLAYVATDRQLGAGRRGPHRRQAPGRASRAATGHGSSPPTVGDGDRSISRSLAIALTPGYRATAEDRGVEVDRGRACAPLPGRDRRRDLRGRIPADPLARRRRRPASLARPARLLDLPRRAARPGRRRAPTATPPGSARTRSPATVDVRPDRDRTRPQTRSSILRPDDRRRRAGAGTAPSATGWPA